MASVAARRRSAWSVPGRWLASVARNTTFAAAGIPLQLACLGLLVLPFFRPLLLLPGVRQEGPMTGAEIFRSFVISVVMVAVLRPLLSQAQRHRCWSILGVAIPRPTARAARPGWRGLVTSLRSEATWRQVGYHVVVGPVLAAGGMLMLGLWAVGLALAGLCGYAWAFPLSSSVRAATSGHPLRDAYLTAAGVMLLVAAALVAAAMARLDILAAAALLGPSRSGELARRVESLAESRAGVVDAADAERRRIERDLHDGAQQRLVSLAMNLGLARENLTGLPEARQVIADAHREAKEALAELRHLVRGLHPAVLEDRGLDAALSGIAARAPLPVRVRVDVPRRASPTVEAIAYFVVSEALANIARHAGASKAVIDVQRRDGTLRVVVTDDGAGGADPSRGTGLAGLTQRARSVDGTLRIDSPPGGPTTITAELPCGS
jgi:signal transduction histidine kinase